MSKPAKWTRTPAGVVLHEIWVARTVLRASSSASKTEYDFYTGLMETVPDDDSEVMHAFAVAMWKQPDLLHRLRDRLPRHSGTTEQLLQAVLASSVEPNVERTRP